MTLQLRTSSKRTTVRALWLPLLVGSFLAAPLSAQERACGSPFIPSGHWSRGAIERVSDLGLTNPGFDLGTRSLSQGDLNLQFRAAARAAILARSPHAPLARAYALRFAEEFDLPLSSDDRSVSGYTELNYQRTEGDVRAGTGYANVNDWSGTYAVADVSEPGVGGAASFTSPLCVGGRTTAHATPNGIRIRETYLIGEKWGITGWAGRRAIGYGQMGEGTGLLLNGNRGADGIGFALAQRIYLPGAFRWLGLTHFETFTARIESNGDLDNGGFEKPWLWGGRGSATPHPRFTIGLNRAAMFGGEGNSPVTLGNLARLIFTGNLRDSVGVVSVGSGSFANQLISADVRFLPPLGPIPLLLYVEAGMDDGSGGWRDVPGVRAGATIVAVPGIPQLRVGLERTSFAHSCCGNSSWYRNWSFRGGWTDAGRPLGHPLAGQGVEWRLHGALDLLDARVRLSGAAVRRERGPENLYAPERGGKSQGGYAVIEARPRSSFEVFSRIAYENSPRGWTEFRLYTGGRMMFGRTR